MIVPMTQSNRRTTSTAPADDKASDGPKDNGGETPEQPNEADQAKALVEREREQKLADRERAVEAREAELSDKRDDRDAAAEARTNVPVQDDDQLDPYAEQHPAPVQWGKDLRRHPVTGEKIKTKRTKTNQ